MDTFDLLPALVGGNLGETCACELVAAIYRSKASGTLSIFAEGGVEIRQFFRMGDMCGSAFFTGFRTLGMTLREAGWVPPELVEETLAYSRQVGRPHGQILVERGLLDEDRLRQALVLQHRQNLAALLAIEGGKYELRGFEPPPAWSTELLIDPVEPLLEALKSDRVARRRERILAWLGRTPVRLAPDWPEIALRTELEAPDRRAAQTLMLPRSIDEFVKASQLPRQRAEALLVLLLLIGAAVPREDGARPRPPGSSPGGNLSRPPSARVSPAAPSSGLGMPLFSRPSTGPRVGAVSVPPPSRSQITIPGAPSMAKSRPMAAVSVPPPQRPLAGSAPAQSSPQSPSQASRPPPAQPQRPVAPASAPPPPPRPTTPPRELSRDPSDEARVAALRRMVEDELLLDFGTESAAAQAARSAQTIPAASPTRPVTPRETQPPDPFEPSPEPDPAQGAEGATASADESAALRRRMRAQGMRNLGAQAPSNPPPAGPRSSPPPAAPQQQPVPQPPPQSLRSPAAYPTLEEQQFMDEVRSRAAAAPAQDAWARLGLQSGATTEQIRAAYLDGAKRFHPDRAASATLAEIEPELRILFNALREAYDAIGSEEQRAAYAAERKSQEPARGMNRKEEAQLAMKMGEALLKKRDYSGAVTKLRRATDLDGTPDSLSALAWGLMNDPGGRPSDKEEAMTLITRALRLSNPTARTYYVAGVMWRTRDPGSAAEAFRKALELEPNHADASLELRLLEMRKADKKGGTLSSLLFGKKK